MLMILAILLAADGGTSIPPMLRRPSTYRFVSWEPGGVPEQLKAPCPDIKYFFTIEGKCWGRSTDRPPCPPETWPHGDRCYLPVVEEFEVPAS